MSDWLDLTPPTKSAKASEPVRIGFAKMRGAKSRARLLVRAEVFRPLAMTHWRVAIRVGQGARRHQIAIVPADDGKFCFAEVGVAKGGGVYAVTLPNVSAWPDVQAPAAPASFKVEDVGKSKILVIDLPAFCWDARARAAMEARMRDGG